LSASALAALDAQGQLLDSLTDAHRTNLARHRLKHGF